MTNSSFFPNLGCGLGLRSAHHSDILAGRAQAIDWFEATTENYIGLEGSGAGRPLKVLEKVREDYPIVLHGVSLSIGSVDPIDFKYLARIKSLYERIQPAFVSDHLCWTGVEGENLHDLLPLPYTQEALAHLVSRIGRVQDFLGRRILLENVSSYIEFSHSEMTEWEFLSEVARQADCGILLDVNNIYVSSVNHGFDPLKYLHAIPRERVGQIHLAGHSNLGTHLVDTHDHPVPEPVWSLFEHAVRHVGQVSTMIERDDNIPELSELEAEVQRAFSLIETHTADNHSRQPLPILRQKSELRDSSTHA